MRDHEIINRHKAVRKDLDNVAGKVVDMHIEARALVDVLSRVPILGPMFLRRWIAAVAKERQRINAQAAKLVEQSKEGALAS